MINSPSILKTLTVKRIQARLHAFHMYHFTTGLPFANINIKSESFVMITRNKLSIDCMPQSIKQN